VRSHTVKATTSCSRSRASAKPPWMSRCTITKRSTAAAIPSTSRPTAFPSWPRWVRCATSTTPSPPTAPTRPAGTRPARSATWPQCRAFRSGHHGSLRQGHRHLPDRVLRDPAIGPPGRGGGPAPGAPAHAA
jgi:hypothetical protein